MSDKFYGYKHWTTEETPRCFYVGKGKIRRPFVQDRSKKWHAVVKRYGLRVEVCLGPVADGDAIAWEISNIVSEGTFTTSYSTSVDIGCNFTKGGDGASGYRHTEKFKRSVSLRCKGKPGRKWTDKERARASLTRKGVPKQHKENYGKYRRRAVQQLDELGNVIAEFNSGVEARAATGASCAEISLHCRGHRNNPYQRWQFKRDD